MSLIDIYTKKPEEIHCEWCGLPLNNDDYMFGGDVVCKRCYEVAHRGSTAIDYVIDLLQTGQTGSVISFLKDLRNIECVEDIGAWIRGYFEEDYEEWVKF